MKKVVKGSSQGGKHGKRVVSLEIEEGSRSYHSDRQQPCRGIMGPESHKKDSEADADSAENVTEHDLLY
jgi:hypothetical protein